jgi:hypothetical protein
MGSLTAMSQKFLLSSRLARQLPSHFLKPARKRPQLFPNITRRHLRVEAVCVASASADGLGVQLSPPKARRASWRTLVRCSEAKKWAARDIQEGRPSPALPTLSPGVGPR